MTRPFWMTTYALVLSGTALIMSATTAAPATTVYKFAVVKPDGTLARGKGVVSVVKNSTGIYIIKFNRDISRCSYSATIVSNLPNPFFVGIIVLTPALGDPTSLFSTIHNLQSTLIDGQFHVIVLCES